MHKTGSSSIQATFFGLRNGDLPWIYLNAGNANSSEALLNMFKVHPESYHINVKKGLDRADIAIRRQNYFKKFEEQIAASDKDLLLSAEGVSKLSEAELGQLAEWIGKYVGEVLAVGYVRPPKAYMESSFQQNMKGGLGSFNIKNLYPHYQTRFGKFEVVFGKGAVQYWLFDPGSLVNGCVVRDFASRFGIALSGDQIIRVNESLSKETLALLYSYRKYGEEYGVGSNVMKENSKLFNKLMEIKGHKIRFSPDLVRPILESNRSDIEWMESRLGQRFSEDIETRSEFDIANEEDLLQCSKESLTVLRQWVGVPEDWPINSPVDVAFLVGQLRHVLVESQKGSAKAISEDLEKGIDDMTLHELYEKVKIANPGQFDMINDKQAVAVLRAALSEVKRKIDSAEDGNVRVPSLGSFRISQVEREVDGKKVVRKRVVFHTPPATKEADS